MTFRLISLSRKDGVILLPDQLVLALILVKNVTLPVLGLYWSLSKVFIEYTLEQLQVTMPIIDFIVDPLEIIERFTPHQCRNIIAVIWQKVTFVTFGAVTGHFFNQKLFPHIKLVIVDLYGLYKDVPMVLFFIKLRWIESTQSLCVFCHTCSLEEDALARVGISLTRDRGLSS
jgi:hypothetical protein